jgi:U3 small nucleolar RNA-associated protein 12
MVKSYLRYSESACLGVVCSGPVVYDRTGERAIVAALSAVLVWNLRTGEKLLTLHSDDIRAEVTALRRSPDGASVAAGYGDGSVRVWSLQDGSCALTFQGHRKGVTALCYTREGNIVASASKDTDIVLWDVVAEAGQCRLQGHKDAVTDMAFLEAGASLQLLSCSKDTLAKVWDVETRHCTQTLVGHRSEIWSLAVSADESRVVTAGSDSELRVWGSAGSASGAAETIEGGSDGTTTQQLECLGTLPRASRARVMTVRFDEAGAGVLAVHSADKAVELFRTRDAAEVAKKHKRKEKRRREKAKLKGGGVDAPAEQETANTAVNPALEYEQICVVRADSKIRAVGKPSIQGDASVCGTIAAGQSRFRG